MCDVCKKLTDSIEHYVFSSIPIHIGGKKYETQIGSCEMSIEYWNQEDWDNKPPFTLTLEFDLGPDTALAEIEAEHFEIHYCPVCGQKLSNLINLIDENHENKNDSAPEHFVHYLYVNYGLSTRAANALYRAQLTSYSDIRNFILTGKNKNEWSNYANRNKYGIRNFGKECYEELIRIFYEYENDHILEGETR